MEQILLAYSNHFKHFYRQRLEPLAAQYGLTQPEVDILLFLYNHPQCRTAQEIVDIRGLSKSNVSTAVEKLRLKGWLTVSQDPANRRSKLLALCPSRQREMAALSACQRACLSVPVTGFAPEELAFLRDLWRRMDENIRRAEQSNKED